MHLAGSERCGFGHLRPPDVQTDRLNRRGSSGPGTRSPGHPSRPAPGPTGRTNASAVSASRTAATPDPRLWFGLLAILVENPRKRHRRLRLPSGTSFEPDTSASPAAGGRSDREFAR
jgi:hypothetical protein